MPPLNIRRATLDDLPDLQALWTAARLPAEELKDRLTEFQVVEVEGRFAGAVGLQMVRQHARMHSEDYLDFSVADAAREAIWERVQTLAANHGVFRIWTQETSPFWSRWGFLPANEEVLARLPAEWQGLPGRWLTLELKNEEAITRALNEQLPGYWEQEQQHTARLAAQARRVKLAVTIIGFTIGAISLAAATWMFFHHRRG